MVGHGMLVAGRLFVAAPPTAHQVSAGALPGWGGRSPVLVYDMLRRRLKKVPGCVGAT